MKNIFISEQVQILLQRMKDHPEDFFLDEPFSVRMGLEKNWSSIARRGAFNLFERIAVRRALRRLDRERTKQSILEKLISRPSDETEIDIGPTITIPSRSQRTLVDIRDDDTDSRF